MSRTPDDKRHDKFDDDEDIELDDDVEEDVVDLESLAEFDDEEDAEFERLQAEPIASTDDPEKFAEMLKNYYAMSKTNKEEPEHKSSN